MTPSNVSVSTASLEDIGLYNLLTRIARGETDVDPLLLLMLQDKGFVARDAVALSETGEQELKGLTVKFGWFYPDT